MKKIKITTLCLFALLGLVLPSCDKDGDWDNSKDKDIFAFEIERDEEFPEKAINEVTYIKTRVNAVYNFDKLPMNIKVVYHNGEGVLTLNGVILENNSSYILKSKDNVFEYVGKNNGSHNFSITFTNEKKVSRTAEFRIQYATTEFSVVETASNPNQEVWQGDVYSYLIKIEPHNPNKPTNDYQIRFDIYDGNILLNGSNAELNRWYPISNINSVQLDLKTKNFGNQVTLHYSVKNNTTERSNLQIKRAVKQREIKLNKFRIDNDSILNNTNNVITILGNITKQPNSSNFVQYKIWLADYPTNYTDNGINIPLLNNSAYQNATLGLNGVFDFQFTTQKNIPTGRYLVTIQFQDEFENESETRSFEILVEDGKFKILEPINLTAYFRVWRRGGGHWGIHFYKIGRNFKVTTGNSKVKIIKTSYDFIFYLGASNRKKIYRASEYGELNDFIETQNQSSVLTLHNSFLEFDFSNNGLPGNYIAVQEGRVHFSLSNGQTVTRDAILNYDMVKGNNW